MVSSEQHICRGHFSSWSDLPLQVKVLEEEQPSGLSSGQLLRIFNIGEVLVVSDNGDWVCSSLKILVPFFQG